MTTKKMALIRLNPEGLREMLQLPDGAEVVRVDQEPGWRGRVNIVIEGAGWDVEEGGPVRPAGPGIVRVSRDADGSITKRSVDWGFPNTEACSAANDVLLARDQECTEKRALPSHTEYTTKERNSILKILRVVLWSAYKQSPLERSDLVANVVEDAEAQGISVSEGTVRKFAREAFTAFGEQVRQNAHHDSTPRSSQPSERAP